MRFLALIVLTAAAGASLAQNVADEDLKRWKTAFPVAGEAPAGRNLRIVLPAEVFGAAQTGLGDLRLADERGRAVPYALRVRVRRDDTAALPARAFDRVALPGGGERLSLDLGESPPEHNEVALGDIGESFGRPLLLEIGDDAKAWAKLLDGKEAAFLVRDGQRLDVRRFPYAPSRARFVRVTLGPDAVARRGAPPPLEAQVRFAYRTDGEVTTRSAAVEPREPVRAEGEAASAWTLDLGADRVPVSGLRLAFTGGAGRRYLLEVVDGGQRAEIARGTLPGGEVALVFPEVACRRLRLTVIDARNEALRLESAMASAAARVFIFPGGRGPLHLYAGNPDAGDPRYDYAASLPAEPAGLVPVEVGAGRPNPTYVPPPDLTPWTERNRWLLDLVLVAALAALAWVLVGLAREASADTQSDSPARRRPDSA